MKLPDHLTAEDLQKPMPKEVAAEFEWNDFERMTKMSVNRDCYDKHWFSLERRYELAAPLLKDLPSYQYISRETCISFICVRYYLPMKKARYRLPDEIIGDNGYFPEFGKAN